MKLPLGRIAEYLCVPANELGPNFDRDPVATGYSIDSRTIKPGEVFFAVRGERMDGHDFLGQAFENGAIAAVVSKEKLSLLDERVGAGVHTRPPIPQSRPPALIPVEDTLVALQLLAQAVRRLWARPLIAVTGSAGKTTTKEAIAHVLATRFRVHKSEGNFNNHFGLPLMLLKLEPEHDCAVVELGMSHLGEITALAQIAQPDTGVVTNVAPVHLEFFKDISEIARAKYELIESLPKTGTAVLNADDEFVSKFGKDFKGKVVLYGVAPGADVRAENTASKGEQGSVFDVIAGSRREHASLPLVGSHNIQNALAAVAVALERGISLAGAVASLSTMVPADKRGQVVRLGNITVINDCYNSNPKALAAMVNALAEMPAKRRIVIAGEMLELGPQGEAMHRESGQHIASKRIDVLVGVRGLAEKMVEAAKQKGIRAEFLANADAAGEWMARETRDGDVVLLKASRGVKLEKALEKFSAMSRRPSAEPKPTTDDRRSTTKN
ncbi:MAG TPA: UDP-N-acetylmuramoyl-tripeptide--D-alanyl-D-alanine ligase [Terriglobales bacterium]|nr:UDP-N-acetylmuramoyl-tripeptide--D-alanyl-D-alanine ligase [Terriglobales bacterium]